MKLKRSGMAVGLLLVPVMLAVLWALSANAGRGSTGRLDTYPVYGHAEDFSWVAGHITFYIPAERSIPMSGCAILQYQEGDTTKRFQLDGPGWVSYLWASLQDGKAADLQSPLVVLGHPASSSEHFRKCYSDRDAPGYIVDVIKINAQP